MALPQQVKREAEATDQRIRGMAEQQGEPTGDAPQGTPTDDQGAAADNQDPVGDGSDDPGVVQNPDADSSEPPQNAPQDDVSERMRKMEARLQTLQGMVGAKDRQIGQLQDLLAGMAESQQSTKQGEQPQAAPTQNNLVTKDDEDTFGADMIDFTKRVAQDVVQSALTELRQEFRTVNDKLQGVERTAQATAKDSFQTKLSREAPGWEKLDSDPEFIAWLDATPSRKAVFTQGVQDQDAHLVGSFFKEYAATQTAPVNQRKQTRQQELEKQVSPGRSKTTSTPQTDPQQQKVWTRSEISAAYANKKAYPADEFHKLEREIASAQREGRVDFAR